MSESGSGTLLERIGALQEVGPPSGQRIARLITGEPLLAAHSGIIELARASQTSVGSVNRFCRSLGVAGYTELRLALANEVGHDGPVREIPDPSGDIDPATDADETVRIIAAASAHAISRTAEVLDRDLLDEVAERVDRARLVQVIAFGGSAHIATYLAHQLTGIGVTSLTDPDVNTAASHLATLGADDVVIAVSHSGAASHAIELINAAREQRVATVAITSSAVSPLAQAADLSLVTTSRSATARYRGTAGRHAQLFVTDALYVRVAQRRHETAQRHLDRAGELTAGFQAPAPKSGRRRPRRS